MIGTLVAEAIPYTSEKEKFNLTKELIANGKSIEVWNKEKVVYSFIKSEQENKKWKKKRKRKR